MAAGAPVIGLGRGGLARYGALRCSRLLTAHWCAFPRPIGGVGDAGRSVVSAAASA
jgi:hypothetical protein